MDEVSKIDCSFGTRGNRVRRFATECESVVSTPSTGISPWPFLRGGLASEAVSGAIEYRHDPAQADFGAPS
jgi:hypothetical protein